MSYSSDDPSEWVDLSETERQYLLSLFSSSHQYDLRLLQSIIGDLLPEDFQAFWFDAYEFATRHGLCNDEAQVEAKVLRLTGLLPDYCLDTNIAPEFSWEDSMDNESKLREVYRFRQLLHGRLTS
jgi:hypothetical protein